MTETTPDDDDRVVIYTGMMGSDAIWAKIEDMVPKEHMVRAHRVVKTAGLGATAMPDALDCLDDSINQLEKP